MATGAVLMKFVAFYCIFDAANVMTGCVLSSVGDTNWVARSFLVCSSVFLLLLWLVDRNCPGLMAEWSLATVFVLITAVVWILRFSGGAWRKILVLHSANERNQL